MITSSTFLFFRHSVLDINQKNYFSGIDIEKIFYISTMSISGLKTLAINTLTSIY